MNTGIKEVRWFGVSTERPTLAQKLQGVLSVSQALTGTGGITSGLDGQYTACQGWLIPVPLARFSLMV